MVKYIDYDTDSIDDMAFYSTFMHKRKSFEHEREVRAFVSNYSPIDDIDHGIKVAVNLTGLIERIYVAPTTPAWFADLVKTVVGKFGYDFEVVNSRLDEQPLF